MGVSTQATKIPENLQATRIYPAANLDIRVRRINATAIPRTKPRTHNNGRTQRIPTCHTGQRAGAAVVRRAVFNADVHCCEGDHRTLANADSATRSSERRHR